MKVDPEQSAGPAPSRAPDMARALCDFALAWAQTLALGVQRDLASFEDVLFEEIVAYSLCLVELRWPGPASAHRQAFLGLLQHECAVLKQRRLQRRQRHRRLPPPAASRAPSQYDEQYLACRAGRCDKKVFAEFCRCTGLGSEVLVGEGENLAALVFYIVLHGVLSTPSPLTREETLRLLRAAREGRKRLEVLITSWLVSPAPTTGVLPPAPAVQ